MPRPALNLTRLEAREVPAAGLFAEIRPGVWGSNPELIAASGDTLYFTANDIYHGTELWATDGTRAGTRMVKDLNPGKPGSSIWGTPDGKGGLNFWQYNKHGSGGGYYHTDGTAAGTVAAPTPNSLPGGAAYLAEMKGETYYLTKTGTAGVWALSKTDGTTTTTLGTFNGQPLREMGWTSPASPVLPSWASAAPSAGVVTVSVSTTDGKTQVWQTDGTAAGTVLQQSNLTATSPTTGAVPLNPGTKLASGQYLFRSVANEAGTSSLWVGTGTGTARTFLRRMDGVMGATAQSVNGRVLFTVEPRTWNGLPTADTGVWVSDGTPAGTKRLNLPTAGDRYPTFAGIYNTGNANPNTFDGKALVQVPTADPMKWNFVLTDGTDAGTTPVPTPPGTTGINWYFAGMVPPDAANPKGAMLFGSTEGAVYRTDGTAAGTASVDTAGLPPSNDSWPVSLVGDGRAYISGGRAYGVLFKGSIYYPGRDPNVRPTDWTAMNYGTELYKWDLTTAATPTAPAPTVTGTQVNDGSTQRSMVKSLTVTFGSAVQVAAGAISITDAGGRVAAFTQQATTLNGVTTLTLTFPAGVGGSIADGRWTLKIAASKVTAVGGGAAMAADYTFGFTRVFGDLTGDGSYDREVRTLAKQLQGTYSHDARYNAALDVNGDGVIDAADELAAVRNWGKSV